MNRIVKQFHISQRILGMTMRFFLVSAAFVCLAFGCATPPPTYSPPPVSKADGLSLSGKFRAVAIYDLDNDGNLDVVGGASSPGMVTINYGDGRGGISQPQSLPVKGDVRYVAVADINEDGLADIVFSVQRQSSGIKVWMNQSRRQWQLDKGPIEINKFEGIKTADVNGDGQVNAVDLNVVALNWLNDETSWTEGDFTGDGATNAADLDQLAVNWQRTIPIVGTPVAASVPEPGSAQLVLVLACLWLRRFFGSRWSNQH